MLYVLSGACKIRNLFYDVGYNFVASAKRKRRVFCYTFDLCFAIIAMLLSININDLYCSRSRTRFASISD